MPNAIVSAVKKFPDSPGVYFFVGKKNKILYIGRATSLKNRVLSYFSKDLIGKRGPIISKMVKESNRVKFIKTDSVLEAIILEANLIKKLNPPYNTKEKSDKSFNYIVITKEDFPRVLVVRGKGLDFGLKHLSTKRSGDHAKHDLAKFKKHFGPFPQGSVLKEALKIIRKIFPWRDKCLPGIGKPCFDRQIGLCPGVCTGEISKKDYGKIITNISLFLSGKKKAVIVKLTKEMAECAKRHEFEKANSIKKTIFSLKHIQDVSLIKNSVSDYTYSVKKERIEGYDIAHLSGGWNVGVMTVVKNGILDKANYRKFKIQGTGGGDTGALEEVLSRRLRHGEWGMPSIVVMDGGVAQKNVAEGIVGRLGLNIPVVSVVKNEKHKPKNILGDEKIIDKFRNEILLVNNEAHRFALKYHRSLRLIKKGIA